MSGAARCFAVASGAILCENFFIDTVFIEQEIFKIVKAELEKLVELQLTDTNIRKLKKAVESADQRRAAIEQEFEQHASSIREIQTRRDRAQAERAELENKINENKTYLERADRNLKHAQNQKEY